MIEYRVSSRELVLLIECLGYEAGKIQYLPNIKGFVMSIVIFGALFELRILLHANEIENYHRNLERIIHICVFSQTQRRVAFD